MLPVGVLVLGLMTAASEPQPAGAGSATSILDAGTAGADVAAPGIAAAAAGPGGASTPSTAVQSVGPTAASPAAPTSTSAGTPAAPSTVSPVPAASSPAGDSGAAPSVGAGSTGSPATGSPVAGAQSAPAAAATVVPASSLILGQPNPLQVPGAPIATTPTGTDPANGPAGPAGSWRMVFQDEFSGSAVDGRLWRSNRSGGSNRDGAFNPDSEGAFFAPENVTVGGGVASLTVHPESATVAGTRYTYSSGTLSSEGRFALRDGDYVEARLFVPSGPGLWPAFWTVPSNRWPPEIDIFEFFDSSQQKRPQFNYHPTSGGQSGPTSYGVKGVDYRDSWHTYGMLRSGGALIPYVDGMAYPAAGVSSGADTFEQFIILNLSTYAGSTPADGTAFQVDWVRAWRQG